MTKISSNKQNQNEIEDISEQNDEYNIHLTDKKIITREIIMGHHERYIHNSGYDLLFSYKLRNSIKDLNKSTTVYSKRLIFLSVIMIAVMLIQIWISFKN